jgi:hypothetical protein
LFSNGETSPDYVNGLLNRFARLNAGSTQKPEGEPGEIA